MDSIPSQGYDNLTMSVQEDYNIEIIHLPEIDGALLMQLLDDVPFTDECENERLDFVIRSLEAEIGSDSGLMVVGDDESMTGPNDMDSDDGGLECIDFDRTMMYDASDDGAWKEMGMEAVGSTGREWYAMGEDELEFGEQIECYNYSSAYNYVGDNSACIEQVYSPLWQ
ncbi:hypothetical protein FCM35_KLT00983 [Carex littledalei]|uniref:Uncharacterized protein n=1 Tax=Carex littledalei TaxID=544730 RepID=A0A833R8B4_9POAL|nr:hypothetical protein FCM35_KLT00983 [Carex littledalei]